jgi:hypothetical protein
MMRRTHLVMAVVCAALGVFATARAENATFAPGRLDDCRARLGIPEHALTTVRVRCEDPPEKPKGSRPDPKPGAARSNDSAGGKVPGYEKYSCWVAEDRCLQSTGAWGDSKPDRESRRFYTYHRNVCAQRIAVKACIDRVDMKPWCGMNGIEPGKTWTWSGSRATGRYRAAHAGVAAGRDDFICPKPVGWKEMGR